MKKVILQEFVTLVIWGSISPLLSFTACVPIAAAAQTADLILAGARVWTGDSQRPRAEAVAIRGERISPWARAKRYAPPRPADPRARSPGRFVTPASSTTTRTSGRRARCSLGANLLDVRPRRSDSSVACAKARPLPRARGLPAATGARTRRGRRAHRSAAAPLRRPAFRADRALIDSVTPRHPVALASGTAALPRQRARARARRRAVQWRGRGVP